VQAILLDGLLRILAYLTLQGSFTSREQTILKELLQQLGTDPDEALQRIQHYLRQGPTLEPTLLIRNLAQQLTLPERFLFYAYLIQLAHGDRDLTPTEEKLLEEIANAFDISLKERILIHDYATSQSPRQIQSPNLLIVGSKEPQPPTHFISVPHLPGYVAFLYLESANLILMRLIGRDIEAHLNGQWIRGDVIRTFPEGALLRLNYGYTLTYKEVLDQFRPPPPQERLLWEVHKLSYRFKNGKTAIHPLSFEVWQGRLVGIMGPSGAGKSTLIRLLSGQLQPTTGKVYLNGINIHRQPRAIRGLIGYVPQDDLLIEELTVWENVFYAARLSYASNNAAADATEKVLKNLGLWPIKDLTVGSPLNPTISGGQRKRLNIALELVRQPLVLFVDEPTSGLSSSDALQVVETLQTLAREGRIVFFTLHQPSSDIYKKLDHLLFLDEGGYPIFWGSPLAALQHFRHAAGFADSESVECPSCRRVEPESLFDIIQQRLLDEKGQPTEKRRTPPERWYQLFWQRFVSPKTQIELYRPQPRPPIHPLAQFGVFLRREGLRKIRQGLSTLALTLAAPLLGLIVGFILRYHPSEAPYTLYDNDNLPSALFVNILAMLFLGLLTPAEEILKDRKIRLREHTLHLSWGSYMHAKLLWAAIFSAAQTTLYWGTVSWLLQIPNAWGATWLLLFVVALLSNLIALNLSDTFTQPVPIYILIPILLIPQLVLSGAVIPYEKFNPALRGKRPIPLLADISISRWAYESALVLHYTRSPYVQALYPIRREISDLRYQLLYLIPALESRQDLSLLQQTGDTSYATLSTKLRARLQRLQTKLLAVENQLPEALRQKYHNAALEDLLLATHTTTKLLWVRDRPIRLYEPIFITNPDPYYTPLGVLQKPLGQTLLYTPYYNLLVLLLMGVGLWLLLFFRVLNNLFLRGSI
jgi:ABC-type multidrug transport system ATPase subunit/uncharacterized tellurite resistance protein B-like protein